MMGKAWTSDQSPDSLAHMGPSRVRPVMCLSIHLSICLSFCQTFIEHPLLYRKLSVRAKDRPVNKQALLSRVSDCHFRPLSPLFVCAFPTPSPLTVFHQTDSFWFSAALNCLFCWWFLLPMLFVLSTWRIPSLVVTPLFPVSEWWLQWKPRKL